jgi:hypothetical protein
MKPTKTCHSGRVRTKDEGAILVVVLMVMVALLGLGMTGLFLTSGSIQMNANINLRNQALVVAEAGIEHARGILNNRTAGWIPPIPSLLAGSIPSADEIPNQPDDCQGRARGAILIDQISPSCTATPTPANCLLRAVPYPSVGRSSDLPSSAGSTVSTSMGTYTVYLRQDQADCRMGNYTCDFAPSSGVDGGIGGSGGTVGAATCTVPANIPTPNGSVVVRSEGIASDGRTKVVLEVTMTLATGGARATNSPMAALCATGAAGCDDGASVQTGIVVNSTASQAPPTSSSGGTAGGAAGGGGSTVPVTGSMGGAAGTGGATGGGGATGTGGSTSGQCGSSTCTPSQTCCAGVCQNTTSDPNNCGACNARCGGGLTCVGSTCQVPCFNYAISAVGACPTAGGCITINGGTLVDSYDHLLGPYGAGNIGTAKAAMACTLGNVGCPNNCHSGCITGGVDYGQISPYDVNTLPAPPYTPNGTGMTIPPDQTISPADPTVAVYINHIDLNGGTLTLKSGLYVIGGMNLNGGGTLYIDDTNGPVRLWTLNSLSPNCPVIVKSGNPASFWLIYNGTGQINNNSNNSFTGILFAPGAGINLNYAVNGAVIGAGVTMNGGLVVHYDTNLRCL